MKHLIKICCILLLLCSSKILSQDKKILIYDPNGVSSNFQFSFSQLSDDSVFVAATIDHSIFNFDALFLFIDYPYILTQHEGDKLIQYTSQGKPVYLSSFLLSQLLDSASFWNHIGINDWLCLLTEVTVDSVSGVDSSFTSGLVIDTSFISGCVPIVMGNVDSILVGIVQTWELNTTYISEYDSLNVIIDLYNLIHHPEFLERVIVQFELSLKSNNIAFYPPVDTAFMYGGCTLPEIICHNSVSSPFRDSISIEPGINTIFFYYDSTGQQVFVDKYYFIVIDSLDEYKYELWFHPKSWTPFNPVLIPFDSLFYFFQNLFEIQLVVKSNGNRIDSLSQLFRAEWGLAVEENGRSPEAFTLAQNYPNPFNPSTKIKYTIPSVETTRRVVFTTLKVYDVLGNEIATLVNEEKQPGTYEVEFTVGQDSSPDLSSRQTPTLSSGIYFYQLRAGNLVETKKMVLMK